MVDSILGTSCGQEEERADHLFLEVWHYIDILAWFENVIAKELS